MNPSVVCVKCRRNFGLDIPQFAAHVKLQSCAPSVRWAPLHWAPLHCTPMKVDAKEFVPQDVPRKDELQRMERALIGDVLCGGD